MHHDHDMSLLGWLFLLSNVAITIGYISVPFLVLRYLPLTRTVLLWAAGFFIGCAGTHLGMAVLGHGDTAGWFWTIEHVVQAICTWGFIVTFHSMLRSATAQRRQDPVTDGTDRGAL